MAKGFIERAKSPTTKVKAVGKMEIRAVGKGGREVWRVTSDHQVRTITTRNSSTSAMNEAMVIYGDALKRLADR